MAGGVTLTQLVTDFGRTRELVHSSQLTAQASLQHTEDVKQQVLRDVDEAYFATEAAEKCVEPPKPFLISDRFLFGS